MLSLLGTALSALTASLRAADAETPLAKLILANNFKLGPMPKTGGVIHEINAPVAQHIADLITKNAQRFALDVELVAAWLCGESRFDPQAINPNLQDAKPLEDAAEAFSHADVGIAQFDASTLLGMPEFKGMTADQIKAKAFDPAWAIPAFCSRAAALLVWATQACAADASLLAGVPNGDPKMLAIEAYNAGQTGAKDIAYKQGPTGDWRYATSILARAASFAGKV